MNAPKRKYLENEAKMHFAYLRQCSAYSNSTSKDLHNFFFAKSVVHPSHHDRNLFNTFNFFTCKQWGCIVHIFFLLSTYYNKNYKKKHKEWRPVLATLSCSRNRGTLSLCAHCNEYSQLRSDRQVMEGSLFKWRSVKNK